jgi:hypothetical protein
MTTDLLTRREMTNVDAYVTVLILLLALQGYLEFDLLFLSRPRKEVIGLFGITVFEVPPCLRIVVFGTIPQPKELGGSEVYNLQHACDQNGKKTGREYWELY